MSVPVDDLAQCRFLYFGSSPGAAFTSRRWDVARVLQYQEGRRLSLPVYIERPRACLHHHEGSLGSEFKGVGFEVVFRLLRASNCW